MRRDFSWIGLIIFVEKYYYVDIRYFIRCGYWYEFLLDIIWGLIVIMFRWVDEYGDWLIVCVGFGNDVDFDLEVWDVD